MEEFVGKGIDRALQLVHRQRLKGWLRNTTSFETKPHLHRFALLASLVAGREMRVVDLTGDPFPRPYRPVLHKIAHPALLAEYGFGWSNGETIFLPPFLSDMESKRGGDELARLLLFFLATQGKAGSLSYAAQHRKRLQGDTLVADIFWIVENSRLTSLLFNEYPGIVTPWIEATGQLMLRRPRPRVLHEAERRVETLLKEHIDRARSGEPVTFTPEESLKRAETIRDEWRKEGAVTRYRGMVPFPLWGRLLPGRITSGAGDAPRRAARESEGGGGAPPGGKGEREEEAEKQRYLVERREVDEKKNEQGLALNIYDKIISWARFVNVHRPFDDDPDDDAKKKADGMEELTTAQIARKTNASFNAALEKEESPADDPLLPMENKGATFTYPEWDYRRQRYIDDYSRLSETTFDNLNPDNARSIMENRRGTIRRLKRKFEAMTPALRIVGQQLEGDSIDLDAAVEAMVALRGGRQPDDRLFKAYRRNERDIAVLFLVDLSMSTDAWVKEKRVIDHEKEALIVLCEAMERLRDRYAIYGFSGKTRKGCTFFHIKGFDEPSGGKVRERLGGLIPYHYTRMGPAIRHGTFLLNKESARIKLLFIISDGKPNDMDRYEGKYGIEDTRMAIKEAERGGIVPFCLTVDSHAHDYLPRLFGRGNYTVAAGAAKLTQTLPHLYARMVWNL